MDRYCSKIDISQIPEAARDFAEGLAINQSINYRNPQDIKKKPYLEKLVLLHLTRKTATKLVNYLNLITMLHFYSRTCPKQYYLPAIDFQKIDSWTPAENEKRFLQELCFELNCAITTHISYVRDFLKDNELPCDMTKRYRDSLALEYCATYSIFLNTTFAQADVNMDLRNFLNSYLHTSFKNLQAELRRKGFSGLDGFYRKRNKDFGKKHPFQSDIITLKNEMNYRRIFMTDPLAYISFVQPTIADTNRGRAVANGNYLLEQFREMKHSIARLVLEYLLNPGSNDNAQYILN